MTPKSLNPKIYETLEKIEVYTHLPYERDLSFFMANILVYLAEELALQGEKAEKQTEKIIDLTKALKIFTIVLVLIGVVQITLMLKSLF